jgi:acyl carrier protein
LAAAAPRARRALLEEHLREQVGQVLRLPSAKVEVAKPFKTMGLDSLMGLELRNRVERILGERLSATLVWNYPTVTALAAHLAYRLAPMPELVVEASRPEDASTVSDVDLEAALAEVEGLSDEEARRLLRKDS